MLLGFSLFPTLLFFSSLSLSLSISVSLFLYFYLSFFAISNMFQLCLSINSLLPNQIRQPFPIEKTTVAQRHFLLLVVRCVTQSIISIALLLSSNFHFNWVHFSVFFHPARLISTSPDIVLSVCEDTHYLHPFTSIRLHWHL